MTSYEIWSNCNCLESDHSESNGLTHGMFVLAAAANPFAFAVRLPCTGVGGLTDRGWGWWNLLWLCSAGNCLEVFFGQWKWVQQLVNWLVNTNCLGWWHIHSMVSSAFEIVIAFIKQKYWASTAGTCYVVMFTTTTVIPTPCSFTWIRVQVVTLMNTGVFLLTKINKPSDVSEASEMCSKHAMQ